MWCPAGAKRLADAVGLMLSDFSVICLRSSRLRLKKILPHIVRVAEQVSVIFS